MPQAEVTSSSSEVRRYLQEDDGKWIVSARVKAALENPLLPRRVPLLLSQGPGGQNFLRRLFTHPRGIRR
ncbi:unnamed protein product [Ranitomeya imitator]|uniref:Uncharacterized protein n=1 Tax=Ranitomeya imitator TaxID=111125 RepID=A0ABN9M2I7_9NEOB|nr:unnamed protein product [Ranitomeya imitator]